MNKTVTINWSIVPSNPNDLNYAEVLRCDPGMTIFNVIRIEENLGTLNPNEQANFSYNDIVDVPTNTTNTYYYKIKIYDNDGNYSESVTSEVILEMLPPPVPIISSITVT